MAGANLVQIHGYGVVADRPTNSMPGRLYYATDESILYRDNGATWDVLASGDSFPSATEGQILMADSGGVFQAVNVTDLHLDTIGGPGGDTNFNGQKIVNMYGPGDPMDAANKDYVDTQIAGITAFDPSTINLNDLANVDTSGVSGGQVLAYFSGTWQPAGLDFLAASPMGLAAGDMYYYDGSTWTLLHTSGAAGKILRAVGSGPTLPGWDDEVSGAVTYDELADVNVTGLSDGDMMVWDTGTARWIPATPGGGGGGSGHEIRDDADSPLTQRTGLQIIVGSSGATLTDDSGGDQTVLDLSAITGGGGAGYKYLALPTGWRDCWDAAVAAQATTPALVAIIGDSFLQGYGSSDWPANGSQNHIAAAIEALVGSGGDFYAPSDSLAFQAGYQGTPPFVVNGSASPQFLSQGFARTLFNGASLSGTNVTFVTPAACTAIDLLLYRYPNAGTFTYTVDGGSPVTVNVTSLTQGQINRVSLTGLANTTHTIVFGDTSAAYTLGLVGIATYRATTGAYVARCGWGGAKIANYLDPALTQLNSEADGSKRLGTKYWRAAANTDALFPANPHLTILALGINDATAGSSREDYRDALSRFIRALRRGRPDMSVLLVAHNYPDTENADAADPGAGGAYAGYVASLYDVAMEQNCGVVNLFAAWGETSYADGLQGNSDFHPTDAGHQDIADMVMAALSASGGGGGGGGTVASYGPLYPLYKPVVADFTWVNQNSATATDTDQGVLLAKTSQTGLYALLAKALPAAPYSVTLMLSIDGEAFGTGSAFVEQAGVGWRESGSGKLHMVAQRFGEVLELQKWNSPSSFNSVYAATAQHMPVRQVFFVRLSDDNANRTIEFSANGVAWSLVQSVGRTDWITADQLVIGVNPDYPAVYTTLTLLSYDDGSLPRVGALAGGGGGGGGSRSGLERIAQVVVGAGGQATVSFTTIPSDYEDLIVGFLARSESGSDDHLHMRFNADTAGNYDTTYTHNYPGGMGSGLHVDGGTAARPAFIASGSSLSANAAAQGEVTINGYARTFFRKLWRSKSLVDYDGASNYEIMGEYGGIWRSTAAITRIDFFTNNGSDIAEGSVFTLYGRV